MAYMIKICTYSFALWVRLLNLVLAPLSTLNSCSPFPQASLKQSRRRASSPGQRGAVVQGVWPKGGTAWPGWPPPLARHGARAGGGGGPATRWSWPMHRSRERESMVCSYGWSVFCAPLQSRGARCCRWPQQRWSYCGVLPIRDRPRVARPPRRRARPQ